MSVFNLHIIAYSIKKISFLFSYTYGILHSVFMFMIPLFYIVIYLSLVRVEIRKRGRKTHIY